MNHSEYVVKRVKASEIARAILDGRLSVLEGSRSLARLGDLEVGSEHLEAFVVIDSETEDLPIGTERVNWSAEALARKAQELAKAEAWARPIAFEACKGLLKELARVPAQLCTAADRGLG